MDDGRSNYTLTTCNTHMSLRNMVSAAALAVLLSAGAASAQTTTSTTTPGTPNTGVGGSATTNAIVLGSTAAIALLGAAYIARKRQA